MQPMRRRTKKSKLISESLDYGGVITSGFGGKAKGNPIALGSHYNDFWDGGTLNEILRAWQQRGWSHWETARCYHVLTRRQSHCMQKRRQPFLLPVLLLYVKLFLRAAMSNRCFIFYSSRSGPLASVTFQPLVSTLYKH